MDYPVGASVIWCAMGDYLGVDLRLLIGWRNSFGFCGLMASALKHSHTLSTSKFATVVRLTYATYPGEEWFGYIPPSRLSTRFR